MRTIIIAFVAIVLFTGFKPAIIGSLCKENEQVIINFKLINSKKSVSLCKERNGKYIVYRFGSKDKIELEYPTSLDESSWKVFKLYGEKRFGGKANAGFGDYTINFINNKVEYQILEIWDDEQATKEIGIKVIMDGRITLLKGDFKTKDGTLLRLDDETDKIKNSANE